jgi:hypothetical protein
MHTQPNIILSKQTVRLGETLYRTRDGNVVGANAENKYQAIAYAGQEISLQEAQQMGIALTDAANIASGTTPSPAASNDDAQDKQSKQRK